MQKETEGKVLAYRVFRLRHRVSLNALARASGISKQRISEIELLERPITPEMKDRLLTAMVTVAHRKTTEAAHTLADLCMEKKLLFRVVSEVI